MPQPDARTGCLVITGSSGFIGTHLCRAAGRLRPAVAIGVDLVEPSEPSICSHEHLDIRCADQLTDLAGRIGRPEVLIHFAASAEVVMPWNRVPELLSTNIEGTRNVLDALQPKLVVFASSGSVYGNARADQTDPAHQTTQPLSLYAMSKLAGEMVIRDWARSSGGAAVALRLGNVIGPGCRGLIAYVGRHLRNFPDGTVPARLRGGGRLVRDYVPVEAVVDATMAAVDHAPLPGNMLTVNVGTGRAMTNGDVVGILTDVARRQGFQFKASFDDPPEHGEATEIVLDPVLCEHALGVTIPSQADVVESISRSLLPWLT